MVNKQQYVFPGVILVLITVWSSEAQGEDYKNPNTITCLGSDGGFLCIVIVCSNILLTPCGISILFSKYIFYI
jgi:hypothetical protein